MANVSATELTSSGTNARNIEPQGYVAILELPSGRVVATLMHQDVHGVRVTLSSLVPEGAPVVTRAIVPVVGSPAELLEALVEAVRS